MNTLISKLTSGRFLLTIISGIVFAICVWKNLLEAAAISSIITMVFNSYFMRNDRDKTP